MTLREDGLPRLSSLVCYRASPSFTTELLRGLGEVPCREYPLCVGYLLRMLNSLLPLEQATPLKRLQVCGFGSEFLFCVLVLIVVRLRALCFPGYHLPFLRHSCLSVPPLCQKKPTKQTKTKQKNKNLPSFSVLLFIWCFIAASFCSHLTAWKAQRVDLQWPRIHPSRGSSKEKGIPDLLWMRKHGTGQGLGGYPSLPLSVGQRAGSNHH